MIAAVMQAVAERPVWTFLALTAAVAVLVYASTPGSER